MNSIIKNILALGGDNIEIGDHPKAKAVYDIDTIGLIQVIEKLNNGESLSGKKLNGNTDFFIGGAHSISNNFDKNNINRLFQKIESGARFFQTQPVFSYDIVEKFYENVNIPKDTYFILGILLPISTKMIDYVNNNIPGIEIPSYVRNMMEKANNPIDVGIDIVVNIIKDLWNIADGFHIMAINNEDKIPLILEKIK